MGHNYQCPDCGAEKCCCPEPEALNTENVNDRQVGGDHYRAQYQHWDWVTDLNIPYLIGCATKYIIRWKRKGGAEDIQKAIHYLEKYVSLEAPDTVRQFAYSRPEYKLTNDFLTANDVGQEESEIVWIIMILISLRDRSIWENLLKGKMETLLANARKAAGAGRQPGA